MRYRLGIVLSGGGSRGLAHAGVLRALAEEGIAPDAISGSSAGALVGALHAAGYETGDILHFFDEATPFRLSRLALGKPGFIDSEKIAPELRRWFPDDSFEALGKPLFVTGTDLITGRLEIWSSGPLIHPLLASSSVPFVFAPTAWNGRLYADGGIVDNFPVAPLLGHCDVVIGVYASPIQRAADRSLGSSFAVSQRAIEIAMYHASRRKFHRLHLVLSPPELREFSTFDTRRHARIAEIGYRAALEKMDAIKLLLDGDD